MAKRRGKQRRHRPPRPTRHGPSAHGSSHAPAGHHEVIDAFSTWMTDRDLAAVVPPASDVARVMLAYRREGPGDPFTWRVADIEHFLLVTCPERLEIDPDDASLFLGLANLFVAFLDASGRLGPGSDDVERLGRRFEELEGDFLLAMSDEDGDLGLGLGGLAFDADLDDDLAGGLRAASGPTELYLARPDHDEVRAAAEASPLAAQIRALVTFVGDGRRLTQKGNLTLADARALLPLVDTGEQLEQTIGDRTYKVRSSADLPGLNAVIRVATRARFVRKHKGKLVATRAGRSLGEDPVADLDRIEQAIRDIGAVSVRYEDSGYWFGGPFLDWFDDQIGMALPMAAGSDEPLLVDDLVDELLREFDATFVIDNPYWDDDFRRHLVEDVADALITALEDIGLVEVDRETHIDDFGIEHHRPIEARPTAAGVRSLIRGLEAEGVTVREPVHRDASFVELLDAMVDADLPEFQGEVASWMSARTQAEAADAIVEAFPKIDDPQRRSIALVLLDLVDADEAERSVRGALDDPAVGGLLRGWLVLRGQEPATSLPELRPDELIDVLARLAMFDDVDGLAQLLSGMGDERVQLEVLGSLWRVDSPATPVVLESLGAAPLSPRVAKAARKAVMQHRSFVAGR